jgi:hypothetical protein
VGVAQIGGTLEGWFWSVASTIWASTVHFGECGGGRGACVIVAVSASGCQRRSRKRSHNMRHTVMSDVDLEIEKSVYRGKL